MLQARQPRITVGELMADLGVTSLDELLGPLNSSATTLYTAKGDVNTTKRDVFSHQNARYIRRETYLHQNETPVDLRDGGGGSGGGVGSGGLGSGPRTPSSVLSSTLLSFAQKGRAVRMCVDFMCRSMSARAVTCHMLVNSQGYVCECKHVCVKMHIRVCVLARCCVRIGSLL